MCYSRYWEAEDAKRKQEAKDKEAQAKRRETVNSLLTDAERHARQTPADAAPAREAAPAK